MTKQDPSHAKDCPEAGMQDRAEQRSDPRYPLVVKAFVAIPSLTTRVYGICEISRGGMFLAFRDHGATRDELEEHLVQPGEEVEVAFKAPPHDPRHRIHLRATIARMTSHGIAVRFLTHNPPELAPLQAVFARARAEQTASR